MPKVTYVQRDGTRNTVEAPVGTSLMQAAWSNLVSGIEAQCGGCLSCATCHVYVDETWLPKLPAMSEDEDSLLEGVASGRHANSRLSCQIPLTDELDGLEVEVPESQS